METAFSYLGNSYYLYKSYLRFLFHSLFMYELTNNNLQTDNGQQPYFSILIPVYNAAKYLGECLDCILEQDFNDWETIIVDDGSTDGSMSIAEDFSKKDSRIKIYGSAHNSGGAHIPRLRAANLAEGKYLVTIDADDKVDADFLQILKDRIDDTDADIVIPEMWRLTATEASKILPLDSFDASKIWIGKDLVAYTLCNWSIPMAGFAIRPQIYLAADLNISGEDKRSIFADELMSRWILFLCENVAMCKARYYYRVNEESVTHVNLPRLIESRMNTCDGLIMMAAKAFGEETPTFYRALENKLYSAAGLLRAINRSRFKGAQRRAMVATISSSMKNFDYALLKGKTSPRYLALMRLPAPLARIALKMIDTLMGK